MATPVPTPRIYQTTITPNASGGFDLNPRILMQAGELLQINAANPYRILSLW
jgi:hypothetical protein